MILNKLKPGQQCILITVPTSIRSELIRLGLCEGDRVKCVAKIPGGPVVLQKDLQETAIGNEYSQHIIVEISN